MGVLGAEPIRGHLSAVGGANDHAGGESSYGRVWEALADVDAESGRCVGVEELVPLEETETGLLGGGGLIGVHFVAWRD